MTIRNAFWLLVIGLVCLMTFLAAMDAWDPDEAVAASIALCAGAALWAVHMVLEHRHAVARDPRMRANRERRGF